MSDLAKPPDSGSEEPRTSEPLLGATISDEPFACPACGQMLAPGVRVCAVCKRAIDPAEIRTPKSLPASVGTYRVFSPPGRARFSWQIFLIVLFAWLVLVSLTRQVWGPVRSQIALVGIQILSSAWVLFDAQQKGVPQPLRWGLGSLLLWPVIFPWYLARRRTPKAPCPFVEAKVSPLSRALLVALMVFFLLSVVLFLLNGPK